MFRRRRKPEAQVSAAARRAASLPSEELKTTVDVSVSSIARLVRINDTSTALLYSEAVHDIVRELHSRNISD